MACLSHPDKKLITHLKNVEKIGLQILAKKKNLKLKIKPKELQNLLKLTLFYHDIGKSTVFFQEYLQASIDKQNCKYPNELTRHSLLSAIITAEKIRNNFQNSNNYLLLAILAFLAVKKHHGNLENIETMINISKRDWNILQKQINSISRDFKKHISSIELENVKNYIEDFLWELESILGIDTYFLLNFLFSLLVYSDKTDVILGNLTFKNLPSQSYTFVDNYKQEVFIKHSGKQIDIIREDAYKEALNSFNDKWNKDKIFSLNLPTGIGKTLIAINLAFNFLKNDKNLQRIIYAFPFTSIIDQPEIILKDIFLKNNENPDDFLTVHHHLSEIKIKTNDEYLEGDKAHFLIENWDTPFVLTTFWQLFNSIITNKNAQLRKFHNIANSVIILDEVQTIPYKYWNLTNKVLKKLVEILNCKIIFLTATMPLIFDYSLKEITPLIQNREKYFSYFSRYKIEKVKYLEDISMDELLEFSIKDIQNNPEKSFLFIFNTIKSSILFYNQIKKNFSNKKLIYLSTNILPFERKKRIIAIKNLTESKIIISTQVVEAGVDIDLDIVYRDFAPLDSIVQSAGRCNRNNKKEMGIVKIFKLKNSKEKYDYKYIYKNLPLIKTKKLFDEYNEIYEKNLLTLINKYYKEIKQNSSKEVSDNIYKAIEELRYDDIVAEFKLIDDANSFLMFFEIDENAQKLLQQFQDILLIEDRFDRKNQFLKIKNDFYKYILSVRLTKDTNDYFTSLEEIGGIKIVRKDMVDSIYDHETGLKKEFDLFL